MLRASAQAADWTHGDARLPLDVSYLELYQRLYDQKGNKILYEADGTLTSSKLDDQSLYNILLLVALVMSFAVDTSICERGFALMNNLKTARRSRMGNLLLRTLMTICELGKDWADPFKIPVDEIALEWRTQSMRGRYESAMWRAAGLEQPGVDGGGGPGGPSGGGGGGGGGGGQGGRGGGDVNEEGEVDNLEAGGFFARFGRDPGAEAGSWRACGCALACA